MYLGTATLYFCNKDRGIIIWAKLCAAPVAEHDINQLFELNCHQRKETYKVSLSLPSEEKFNIAQRIRRAALSVKLTWRKAQQESRVWKEKGFWKFRVVL